VQPLRRVSADARPSTPSVSAAPTSSLDLDTISLQDWQPDEDAATSPTAAAPQARRVSNASAQAEAEQSRLHAERNGLHALDCFKLVAAVEGPLSAMFTAEMLDHLAGALLIVTHMSSNRLHACQAAGSLTLCCTCISASQAVIVPAGALHLSLTSSGSHPDDRPSIRRQQASGRRVQTPSRCYCACGAY
jgi:hypothetical protein